MHGTKSASGSASTLARNQNRMKPTLGIVVAALVIAAPASAQTMYRCFDLGKTIYSDKPCLNGNEVKQMMPNGNPSEEYVARLRGKARADEQRAVMAERAKREAESAKPPKCVTAQPSSACVATQ